MSHHPFIMGIVNITTDSFSDGGKYLDPKNAIDHGLRLLDQGVMILDLGGQSTRPGAQELDWKTEWNRLRPVLDFFSKKKIEDRSEKKFAISIDSFHEEVIFRALDFGLDYINQVRGLFKAKSLERLAQYPHLQYIYMHTHGFSDSMQEDPLCADDGLQKVSFAFQQAQKILTDSGFSLDRLWFDPGIGFGKDDLLNLLLLKEIPTWSQIWNLTLGVSRKSFIGRLLNIKNPIERGSASTAIEMAALIAGAKMIRTHDATNLIPFLNSFGKYLDRHPKNKHI